MYELLMQCIYIKNVLLYIILFSKNRAIKVTFIFSVPEERVWKRET
jgi:hypothetical protein